MAHADWLSAYPTSHGYGVRRGAPAPSAGHHPPHPHPHPSLQVAAPPPLHPMASSSGPRPSSAAATAYDAAVQFYAGLRDVPQGPSYGAPAVPPVPTRPQPWSPPRSGAGQGPPPPTASPYATREATPPVPERPGPWQATTAGSCPQDGGQRRHPPQPPVLARAQMQQPSAYRLQSSALMTRGASYPVQSTSTQGASYLVQSTSSYQDPPQQQHYHHQQHQQPAHLLHPQEHSRQWSYPGNPSSLVSDAEAHRRRSESALPLAAARPGLGPSLAPPGVYQELDPGLDPATDPPRVRDSQQLWDGDRSARSWAHPTRGPAPSQPPPGGGASPHWAEIEAWAYNHDAVSAQDDAYGHHGEHRQQESGHSWSGDLRRQSVGPGVIGNTQGYPSEPRDTSPPTQTYNQQHPSQRLPQQHPPHHGSSGPGGAGYAPHMDPSALQQEERYPSVLQRLERALSQRERLLSQRSQHGEAPARELPRELSPPPVQAEAWPHPLPQLQEPYRSMSAAATSQPRYSSHASRGPEPVSPIVFPDPRRYRLHALAPGPVPATQGPPPRADSWDEQQDSAPSCCSRSTSFSGGEHDYERKHVQAVLPLPPLQQRVNGERPTSPPMSAVSPVMGQNEAYALGTGSDLGAGLPASMRAQSPVPMSPPLVTQGPREWGYTGQDGQQTHRDRYDALCSPRPQTQPQSQSRSLSRSLSASSPSLSPQTSLPLSPAQAHLHAAPLSSPVLQHKHAYQQQGQHNHRAHPLPQPPGRGGTTAPTPPFPGEKHARSQSEIPLATRSLPPRRAQQAVEPLRTDMEQSSSGAALPSSQQVAPQDPLQPPSVTLSQPATQLDPLPTHTHTHPLPPFRPANAHPLPPPPTSRPQPTPPGRRRRSALPCPPPQRELAAQFGNLRIA